MSERSTSAHERGARNPGEGGARGGGAHRIEGHRRTNVASTSPSSPGKPPSLLATGDLAGGLFSGRALDAPPWRPLAPMAPAWPGTTHARALSRTTPPDPKESDGNTRTRAKRPRRTSNKLQVTHARVRRPRPRQQMATQAHARATPGELGPIRQKAAQACARDPPASCPRSTAPRGFINRARRPPSLVDKCHKPR